MQDMFGHIHSPPRNMCSKYFFFLVLIQSIDKCFIRSSISDEKKTVAVYLTESSEGRQWLDKWLLMTHKRLLRGLLEGEWTPIPSFCSESMNHGDRSVCPALLITTLVVCGPPLNKLYLLIFLEMKGHHLTRFFFFFSLSLLIFSKPLLLLLLLPSKLEHFLSSCLKAFWEKKWF